jgi:hypothetical protein
MAKILHGLDSGEAAKLSRTIARGLVVMFFCIVYAMRATASTAGTADDLRESTD